MAVQQNRKTRSKRGMRRAHDGLPAAALATEAESGETHLRHHITPDGYYRGELVIAPKAADDDAAEPEAA